MVWRIDFFSLLFFCSLFPPHDDLTDILEGLLSVSLFAGCYGNHLNQPRRGNEVRTTNRRRI
jgi:hypothetical protein